MSDLELIKAFAEIDGVKLSQCGGYCESTIDEYNPITDLAINCAARDKYRMEIDYRSKRVTRKSISKGARFKYNQHEGLNKAVLMCILLSEGKL